MQDLQINLYLFLGVVELAAVLAATALFFWWRGKHAVKPSTEQEKKEANSYAQYLEEEISQIQETLDTHEDEETADPEMPRANQIHIGYLQLEHALQLYDKGTESYQRTLKEGVLKLFDNAGDDGTAIEDNQDDPENLAGFTQLREIIQSQNSAVSDLGQNLADSNEEIEGYEEIQTILQTYETQNDALIQCVDMLEKNAAGRDQTGEEETEDQQSLITMVNNQQATIENLRTLVVKLPAEVNPPELEKALDTIQQNNRELNDCVSVLEGENERLRGELEKLSSRHPETALENSATGDKDPGNVQPDVAEEQAVG